MAVAALALRQYFPTGTILVYRPGDIFTKVLDRRQHGFGPGYPHEGTGLTIVVLHTSIDFADEFSHLAETTASHSLPGHDAQPTFHFIDP